MTTLATDNFNRADGALGANWAVITVGSVMPVIVSNAIRPPTVSTFCSCYWVGGPVFPADQWMQTTAVAINGTTQPVSTFVRAGNNGVDRFGYAAVFDNTGCNIYWRTDNSTFGLLATSAVPLSNGDVIYMEVRGNIVTLLRNGAAYLTANDTGAHLPSGGAPGYQLFNATLANSICDNFTAGDFNLTAALTGSAGTFAAGTLGVSHAQAVTGGAGTFGAGTLTTSRAKALTGISGTLSRGSLTATRTKALTGSAGTFAPGSLVPAHGADLVGSAGTFGGGSLTTSRTLDAIGTTGTFSPGSVAAALASDITGVGGTFEDGSLTTSRVIVPTGTAGTFEGGTLAPGSETDLTGEEGAFTPGSVAMVLAPPLTGEGGTFAPGALATSRVKALTGASATFAAGSLTYSATLAVTGAGAAWAAGIITTPNDIVINLNGQAVTFAAGTLGVSRAKALTGSVATFSPGTLAVQRALDLLGLDATWAAGTVVRDGGLTLALTGIAASFDAGTIGNARTVELVGIAAAFAAGNLGYGIPVIPSSVPRPSRAGTFATRNPYASMVAGSQIIGGPNGVALGRFAWANLTTGIAANIRSTPDERLGFSLLISGVWQRVFWRDGVLVSREGQPVTLMTSGDFWARFEGGASAGQPVYASLVDGQPLSGYADGAEITPWFVVTDAAPGDLAIISTYTRVTL